MAPEVLEKLAIAELFAHHAQYAGVPRQAVADGYSAIDALFSAVLVDRGAKPPKNHWEKLDAVRRQIPDLFATRSEQCGNGFSHMAGIPWDEIEAFYREWLRSRYEQFKMTAGQARHRVLMAMGAKHFVVRHLSDVHGLRWYDLTSEISRAAYGYDDTAMSEALSIAHDRLFSEAEDYGESIGRKLSVKMASTTNFCGTDIIAGDEITRRIIEQDEEIAAHAMSVYTGFCRLMDGIRIKRLDVIRATNPSISAEEAADGATAFMLSMKAKYHGERLSETGAALARMLDVSFNRLTTDDSPLKGNQSRAS